jgi:lysophospholipase L1-like esterase
MTSTRKQAKLETGIKATSGLLAFALSTLLTAQDVNGDWTRSIRSESKPDKSSVLQSFASSQEIGDRYGSRIHGFIYPELTGEHVFGITSDDQSKLFLSTDSDPKNKKLIAYTNEWTEVGKFNKYETQRSKPVRLERGRKYYIETIHRENSGGDHVSAGWIIPGKSTFRIIPGSNISPFPTGSKGKIIHEVWRDPVAPPIKGTPPVTVTSSNDPTKPVPGGVRWFWNNHLSNLNKTKANNFDLCFLGDSITSGWPGDLMNTYFGKYKPANFGIGGDRAENVLFRLENGELQWTSPKVIVLLLGTNNSGMNNSGEIALGVATVIRQLRGMLPETKILLLAIFPSKDPGKDSKTRGANTYLAKMDDGKMVRYLDINAKFMDKDGKLRNDVMQDGVHLNRNGYAIWGENIAKTLDKMMK